MNTWRVAIYSHLAPAVFLLLPPSAHQGALPEQILGGLARFRCSTACKAARAVAHRRAPSLSLHVSGGDDVPAVLGG